MSYGNTHVLLLVALASLAACSKDTKAAASAGVSDSTPELTLATRDSTAVPQFRDTPLPPPAAATPAATTPAVATPAVPAAAPAPTRHTSNAHAVASSAIDQSTAPTPAAPAPPVRREIRSGTTLVFRTTKAVCDASTKTGQTFDVTLDQPVYGSGGAVLNDGTALVRVVSVDPNDSDSGTPFALELVSIDAAGTSYPAAASIADVPTERHALAMKKSTMGKGAALGALGGLLMGRSAKSVIAGAAAGAAGGAVVANATRDHETCIPAGATLSATLKESIPVSGG